MDIGDSITGGREVNHSPQLKERLRISGAKASLLHTPSWRAQEHFYLYFYVPSKGLLTIYESKRCNTPEESNVHTHQHFKEVKILCKFTYKTSFKIIIIILLLLLLLLLNHYFLLYSIFLFILW